MNSLRDENPTGQMCSGCRAYGWAFRHPDMPKGDSRRVYTVHKVCTHRTEIELRQNSGAYRSPEFLLDVGKFIESAVAPGQYNAEVV